MSTLIKVIIALVLSIFLSSCQFDLNFSNGVKGNGNVVNQDRTVPETFNTVKASEGLDVFVSQANQIAVSVEADENIIDLISTEVKNGTLYIECEEQIGMATAKKIYVKVPEIQGLHTSSGATLNSMGTFRAENIELEASSGSDIHVEVEAKNVISKSSSGADIEVYGTATYLEARASSGSDINAGKLLVKSANAHASSGSDINVNASDEIAIHESSGGDVNYKGNPRKTSKVKID